MASEDKKPKLVSSDVNTGSTTTELSDLKDFQVHRVLSENSERKTICVEGRLGDDLENPAIVFLEKMPFIADKVSELLQSSTLRTEFKNDIYGKYECLPDPTLNSLKANLIYPATEKHIAKYSTASLYLVNETPALYETVTLPYIKSEKFNIDWVYNILSHEKESERIVYEDPDPVTGFILLPDSKWSCKQVEDLYLLAMVHAKDIKSLRDLTHRHLPLLKKLWNDGNKAILEKYGVHQSQIRAYIHYQPSHYHFHVHFTHLQYNAPGISTERSHLLVKVIKNIERQPNYYANAMLPFTVKATDKLFKEFNEAGYDFGLHPPANLSNIEQQPKLDIDKLLEFFQVLGRAKHEPCGEHWNVTYGESAWRMAIMAMCLTPELDRKRISKIALTSAFTCMGKEADQNSEWEVKLTEVRSCLCRLLPLQKAGEFYELYCCHVDSRRGVKPNSAEARAYRKLLELEEAILLWEEIQKEGGPSATTKLLSKMKEVGFPGQERLQVFNDVSELQNLLRFFLKISDLIRLKRTGWVQSGIRDPERVAGHMFRMAVMAMLFEEDVHDTKILNGSAVVLSLVHDMAECIVGDITPNDPVSAEDKHTMEMDAMSELVKNLPTGRMALEFFNGLERYEEQHPDDWDAKLTKDLDKFDMILQAYEYEEKCKKGQFLQHFFDSTKTVFKTSQIKAWDSRLRQQRDSTV